MSSGVIPQMTIILGQNRIHSGERGSARARTGLSSGSGKCEAAREILGRMRMKIQVEYWRTGRFCIFLEFGFLPGSVDLLGLIHELRISVTETLYDNEANRACPVNFKLVELKGHLTAEKGVNSVMVPGLDVVLRRNSSEWACGDEPGCEGSFQVVVNVEMDVFRVNEGKKIWTEP
ncbi:hypothetical protein B0J17DRAFT_708828 [Rhizoctonia solani]|nr:hypothetical protein B0J17DRAFT_708828 [Rhizoctonia solani]